MGAATCSRLHQRHNGFFTFSERASIIFTVYRLLSIRAVIIPSFPVVP
jgi:hypothetical protein